LVGLSSMMRSALVGVGGGGSVGGGGAVGSGGIVGGGRVAVGIIVGGVGGVPSGTGYAGTAVSVCVASARTVAASAVVSSTTLVWVRARSTVGVVATG
jgi:hypothetical protein